MLVALIDARDETAYGGKAVQLGTALRNGLPVPPGFVLSHASAEQALSSPRVCADALADLGGVIAVRSSAVGEDSSQASFAGQHASVLGVRSESALTEALFTVLDSSRNAAAVGYRRKLGLDPHPRMAIILQKLVLADAAGVLFTKHPVSRADERVIDASWGLGEAVVQGLVTPDNFRVARGGKLLAEATGHKDVAVYGSEHGGTEQRPVDAKLVQPACLNARQLAQLDALASRCEEVFGGTQDLEFAFEAGALYLLQRRAITRG
jgi:pyruvate, water dikinase